MSDEILNSNLSIFCWMNGWIDERMDGWIDERMNRQKTVGGFAAGMNPECLDILDAKNLNCSVILIIHKLCSSTNVCTLSF